MKGCDEPPVYDTDKLYDVVDVLVEVADDRGVSAAQVALAWLLGRPGVASVIVGARTDEQLADNLRAAELELSEEARRLLDEVSAASGRILGFHVNDWVIPTRDPLLERGMMG